MSWQFTVGLRVKRAADRIVVDAEDALTESKLPFRAPAEFKKADLDARQILYQKLAEHIWSSDRLAEEAAS